MRIEKNQYGVTLIREKGDKRISHESTVTHHIRRLLNEKETVGKWTRFWPYKTELTGCQQGVRNRKLGVACWHANYEVENACTAFNLGKQVTFRKDSIV